MKPTRTELLTAWMTLVKVRETYCQPDRLCLDKVDGLLHIQLAGIFELCLKYAFLLLKLLGNELIDGFKHFRWVILIDFRANYARMHHLGSIDRTHSIA